MEYHQNIHLCMHILRKFSWKEKYPIFVSLSKIVTFLECQFVMVLKSHNIAEKALVYLHIRIYFKGKIVAQELLGSLWCRSLMHYKDDDDDVARWHGMKEWHSTRPAKPKGSIHLCHIVYWGFNYNNNMPITCEMNPLAWLALCQAVIFLVMHYTPTLLMTRLVCCNRSCNRMIIYEK